MEKIMHNDFIKALIILIIVIYGSQLQPSLNISNKYLIFFMVLLGLLLITRDMKLAAVGFAVYLGSYYLLNNNIEGMNTYSDTINNININIDNFNKNVLHNLKYNKSININPILTDLNTISNYIKTNKNFNPIYLKIVKGLIDSIRKYRSKPIPELTIIGCDENCNTIDSDCNMLGYYIFDVKNNFNTNTKSIFTKIFGMNDRPNNTLGQCNV